MLETPQGDDELSSLSMSHLEVHQPPAAGLVQRRAVPGANHAQQIEERRSVPVAGQFDKCLRAY